ncbi:excinuclease ABC subunit C [bacterium]|nr:excinuclease ABC subunit C [bacterium]
MNLRSELEKIPSRSGVYLMRDREEKIIYIGKARSLKKRVSSYFHKTIIEPKTMFLVTQVKSIRYLITDSEKEALILENELIKKFMPKYNIEGKDNKAYPYLKLTIKDDFPRIIITRKIKKDNARYFGPYPDGVHLRKNLYLIKRIFPIRSCKHIKLPKRACLNYYIQRCSGPCLGKINREEYKKITKEVILFLEGKQKQLLKNLNNQMQKAADKLDFEKAERIKKEINQIIKITQKVTVRQIQREDVFREIEKTNLLLELKKILVMKELPYRIEAFDISNISGMQAVGSMVVFENGQSRKDMYRRFKIKEVFQIDDIAMLREVFKRRYKKKEQLLENKKLPDLILVDGGKGQVNSIKKVLECLLLGNIPLIGLAKKEEHIFLPGKSQPLVLTKDSKVLHLLQDIRNEAHRFAITYHRILRRKKILSKK